MEKEIERTSYCGLLRTNDIGKEVSVVGRVSKRRNLGSIIFVDLRDRTGIIQINIKTDEVEIPDIRNEYILSVKGVVSKKDSVNSKIPTGDIEIIAKKVELINTAKQPPFIIADETDALEDIRLKYRYLDLRRPKMLNNFIIRSKIVKCAHEYLDQNGFIEVETPYLAPSTPEGARDYLVPSRIHKGMFYALPQSPQLYKQMLMVGGFERYYQIARCFRDEDLRADRQPDFTQIDIETSFLTQNQFLSLMEGFIQKVYKDVINYDVKLPLRRMPYNEAVNVYGSDKPDTRFDLKLHDLKNIFKNSNIELFNNSTYVKGLKAEGNSDYFSRKKQDEYNLLAKKFKLNSFICLKYDNDEFNGSFAKFLSEEDKNNLIKLFELKNKDVLFIAHGNILRNINFGLGALRSKIANDLNLIKENTYDILWVVDFPLFEKSEETGEITPCHHPFTRPKDEDLDKLETEPYNVYSYTYDIVMNGYEAGGGGLRIYDQEIQSRIFKILGFSEEDIQKKFGFFVESLKYGTPPHGGMAFGLDRLTMIMANTTNIRDVIAFPKNLSAVCPCTNAPRSVDKDQLDELGISIIGDQEDKNA